jgi:2-oxoglutarate ferredoxin oxidoreductase subunit gamma
MASTEIRISGYGGQGVILAAYILGKAASVVEGRHATLNQSFGPEARGSACSAQLILSDDPVTYPYVRRTDILVAMSQEAYRLFSDEVRDGGMALIDDSLVTAEAEKRIRVVGAPATRIGEQLGRRIISNMVMVGLFAGTTGTVSPDAAREAIRTSVPPGTEDLNLAAFDRGLEAGQQIASARGLEVVKA